MNRKIFLLLSLVFGSYLLNSCALSSSSDLRRHIAILASDEFGGREAGLEGSEKAEQYISDHFDASQLITELQKFDFVAGTRLEDGSRLKLGSTELSAGSFIPASYSGEGEGTAPGIFVGYGISAPDLQHNDFEGIDVKGKVLIALSGSPDGTNPHGKFSAYSSARSKALGALHMGAKAVVIVTHPVANHGGHSYGGLPKFSGHGLSSSVGLPVIAALPGPLGKALNLDFKDLRQKSNEHQKVSKDLSVEVHYKSTVVAEKRTTANVLGWLKAEGEGVLDEVLIVGAHHDHLGLGGSGSRSPKRYGEIHNGADDNASGVAAVIELAKALSPLRNQLKRHVLFMTFGAEEKGLIGSKYFKDNPILSIPNSDGTRGKKLKPIAMINLDMIGRMKDNTLMANGAATSKSWPQLLKTVKSEGSHSINLRIDNAKDLLGSSDHIAFYGMGMPIIFFFTGNNPEYHTPDDDLYRAQSSGKDELLINIIGLTRITRFLTDLCQNLCTRKVAPDFVAGIELTPQMSFSVALRLMPDYSTNKHGMRIEKVTKGGPADLAGLKAGDIITQFGETPVKSVRDYMVGLQKAKAGVPVQVKVKRGDKEFEATITPVGLSIR